ncbi:hypothetical protein C0J52_17078 [Blattella germanica]|nr:hypothetical protein C0J52_17078 [Blattella germanica]
MEFEVSECKHSARNEVTILGKEVLQVHKRTIQEYLSSGSIGFSHINSSWTPSGLTQVDST